MSDDDTEDRNYTPEEAYVEAERRIAEAKAEGWKFLNISGDASQQTHGDEKRTGGGALTALATLPPTIAELTGLERLNIHRTRISDISRLHALSGLQWLTLAKTQVSDLSALGGLKRLQVLTVGNTPISDLRALKGLRGLQRLFFNNTQVSDMRALEGISGLQRLYLDNTQVSDLRALEDKEELSTLTFENTPVLAADPKLQEFSSIYEDRKKVAKLQAYLRARTPPEPSEPVETGPTFEPQDDGRVLPPRDPQEIEEALNQITTRIAHSDIRFENGTFQLKPILTARTITGQPLRDAIAALKWRAGELIILADANKLGAHDARRAATYIEHLDAPRPQGAMLRAMGEALIPEITQAVRENRLSPGDEAICTAFRDAHEDLLQRFFPEEVTALASTDAIELSQPVTPSEFVHPAKALGGVVRDHEAISEEFKDFVAQIELIAEDEDRIAAMRPDDPEAATRFERFAKRTASFIKRFILRVQQVISLEDWTPAEKASGYGLVLALHQSLLPLWSKLVELLPSLF